MKADAKFKEVLDNLKEAKTYFENLLTPKQEEYDNAPESWQESEDGKTLSDEVDILDETVIDLDSIIDRVELTFESEEDDNVAGV